MTDTPASGKQQQTTTDERKTPETVSSQQMGLMLDAIPARIWFHDCQHKVCFANREAAALFKLEPDELIGRSAKDLLGEEGFEQDKSHREAALSGAVAIWEGWTNYSDGESRYTHRIFSPHVNREGEIDGYCEFVRDVTEQKRAEQELRQSAQLLNDAIESLSDGLALFDSHDRLVMCNSRFRELNNPLEDLLAPGTSWVDIARAGASHGLFPEAIGRVDEWLEEQNALRSKAAGVEFSYRDDRWFAYSHRPTREGGFVSTWREITERRQKNAELSQQREMLHQAEKLSAMGELLAGVSHELNNPLSVLVGQALMLQESASDETTAARAERIGKAADRCARIVKTFLAMARQEPTATELVDLNEVIESALEVTAYALRTSGIEVTLRLAKDLPMVVADPNQMNQILTNLIVNAQHALQDKVGPRRLRIVSSYRKKADQIAIKVKDNGPGISDEIRSRIFEPLFTTKKAGIGTGMGLALCNRIVEGHGGTIAVESQSGSGASFAVRLPASGADVDEQVDPDLSSMPSGRYRILVVEDDYDVGQNLSDILEYEGHAVDIAGTGKVALDNIKRRRYDVVLSDIRMPEMDGFSFFHTLRDTYPDQVSGLAFITGDTLTSQVKEFLDASERPYLEKPIMPRDICELVDLLTRRKLN